MSSTTIHKFIFGSAGCAILIDGIEETPARDLFANAVPEKSAAALSRHDISAAWRYDLVNIQKTWMPGELCSGVLVLLGEVT